MGKSRAWQIWATGVVLLAAMIWPALYNGQPVFFADTPAYIRGADAGIQAAFHHRSAWSLPQEAAGAAAAAAAPGTPAAQDASPIKDKTVLTGRSVYYGALLYLGDLAGGFWLTVLVQSAAVLMAVWIAIRAADLKPWPVLPAAGALLVCFTTVPFFVSLLMPDVFAGVAIIIAATVLTRQDPGRWREYRVPLAMLTAAALVHDSHVLILAGMLALALLWNAATRSFRNWRGLTVIGLTIVIAFLAQTVFTTAVKHATGSAPLRPPFLMARLIEDGPGYRYLRDTCPGSGFAVCAYVGQLPQPSDDFLWLPEKGVFMTAAPGVRRQLSAEQMRFALAVLAHEPVGTVLSALRNATAQLFLVGLFEFNYDEATRTQMKIPAADLGTMQRSAAYHGTMPTRVCERLFLAVLLAAVVALARSLAWPAVRARLPGSFVQVTAWVLVGILINAVTCGVLSGPHMRYSARVDWIIPLFALLLLALERAQRPMAREDSPRLDLAA